LILPHHMVAVVDENESDQLRDIQHFHIAETGRGPADAGKKRADGDEDVAEEAGSSPILGEILDSRIDSSAKKKNQGVEVEGDGKIPDPWPAEHASSEALVESLRNGNRREQHTNGGNDDYRRAHHGRDIGKASVHQQV